MSRERIIKQAQELLEELGMDAERYNERSAMTFLALAHMDGDTKWEDATGEMYTTRQIMDWIRDRLGTEYAPNTRETIRRFLFIWHRSGLLLPPSFLGKTREQAFTYT